MFTCPACGHRAIGKVGTDQYYCWDCCVEFTMRDDTITVFNVEPDGTLTLYGDAAPLEGELQLQKG